MPRGSNVCRQCYYPQLTWSEQRQQFGRLIDAGYSREQIKQLMPRCRRCVSELLRAAGKPQWAIRETGAVSIVQDCEGDGEGHGDAGTEVSHWSAPTAPVSPRGNSASSHPALSYFLSLFTNQDNARMERGNGRSRIWHVGKSVRTVRTSARSVLVWEVVNVTNSFVLPAVYSVCLIGNRWWIMARQEDPHLREPLYIPVTPGPSPADRGRDPAAVHDVLEEVAIPITSQSKKSALARARPLTTCFRLPLGVMSEAAFDNLSFGVYGEPDSDTTSASCFCINAPNTLHYCGMRGACRAGLMQGY